MVIFHSYVKLPEGIYIHTFKNPSVPRSGPWTNLSAFGSFERLENIYDTLY